MIYPQISEYIEAIKSAEDNFDQLSHLRPVMDDEGNPVMTGGNFAEVFKMKDEQTGKVYAVKCFLREQEGRAEAYRLIAEELENVSSTYLTPIRYLEKELFVDTNVSDETEFPVLLMDWVEGVTLDKYIRENIHDEYALSMLAYQFSRLTIWLMAQPFAHGDLKPDNILVKNDGTLALVDYDGMYVPAMKGQRARELGSPDFRYPLRTEYDFNEHIDDFSLASILLSLKAIALHPGLLEEYGASDRLLFSGKDYRNISQCNLLKELFPSEDSELNIIVSLFTLALEKNNLANVSFRLFDICRPKEPEYVNLSTEVTEEDLANAWTDEYGVKYSQDRKRLLECKIWNLESYSIRKGTRVICDNAFVEEDPIADPSSLLFVNIPDTVTHIGHGAFWCLGSLLEIHIPNSVIHIGSAAFADCCSLSEIHIPDSVIEMGEGVFSGCSNVKSMIVDLKNNHYDSRNHCNAIINTKTNNLISGCSSTIIPDSVTQIGPRAFSQCSSLSEIDIPKSVTGIGDYAFCGCKSLTRIYLPDSVTYIGKNAFKYCRSLEAIVVSSGAWTKFEKMLPDELKIILIDVDI